MSENLNETLVEESNSVHNGVCVTYRLIILTLQRCINRGRNRRKCGRIWCGWLKEINQRVMDWFGDRRGPGGGMFMVSMCVHFWKSKNELAVDKKLAMESLQPTQYVSTEEFVQLITLLKTQEKVPTFPAHIFAYFFIRRNPVQF